MRRRAAFTLALRGRRSALMLRYAAYVCYAMILRVDDATRKICCAFIMLYYTISAIFHDAAMPRLRHYADTPLIFAAADAAAAAFVIFSCC